MSYQDDVYACVSKHSKYAVYVVYVPCDLSQ